MVWADTVSCLGNTYFPLVSAEALDSGNGPGSFCSGGTVCRSPGLSGPLSGGGEAPTWNSPWAKGDVLAWIFNYQVLGLFYL